MLMRLLAWRRAVRERVERDAADLLTFMGEPAYHAARDRAREGRERGDRAGDRHWSRVAVEIARRTGKEIGTGVRDRRLHPEPVVDPQRRAVADGLVEIANAIADFARCRETSTTLHNAEAAVMRVTDLARSEAAEPAGAILRQSLRELATSQAENVVALASGVYPPRADTAGRALERFRLAVLPSMTHATR